VIVEAIALVAVCGSEPLYWFPPEGVTRGCPAIAFNFKKEVTEPDPRLAWFGSPVCQDFEKAAAKLGHVLLFQCWDDRKHEEGGE